MEGKNKADAKSKHHGKSKNDGKNKADGKNKSDAQSKTDEKKKMPRTISEEVIYFNLINLHDCLPFHLNTAQHIVMRFFISIRCIFFFHFK